MLKAVFTIKNGRRAFVIGLSAMNIKRLLAGDPIYFSGLELQLPDHHFVLACVDGGETQMKKLHDHFGKDDPRHLHSIGLETRVLENLTMSPIHIDGAPLKLDGELLLVAGETEQDLARACGVKAQPPKSGFRDELDPLTGLMVRRRVEDA